MSAAFARVIEALGTRVVSRRDGHVQARCCAAGHDDRHASLSVSAGSDGKVLLKCHAGCSLDAIVTGLGLSLRDLFESTGRGEFSGRAPIEHSLGAPKRGVTVAQYAEAKRLSPAVLQSFGLSDMFYGGAPAIRIPYYVPDGSEAVVQYRLALNGADDRFRWKRGSKPVPYGLNRLMPLPTELTLVEGASDCHTLWSHDWAALGLPSATTWRTEWDHYLDGITRVFVVIEPDRGGAAVEGWLAHASFRDRVWLVRLRDGKDPSDSYLSDPDTFRARWRDALERAEPWSDHIRAGREQDAAAAWALAGPLLADPALLTRIGEAVRLDGYAGDVRPAQLAYVAITSRWLERPLNLAFVAPSGAGKNRAVDAAFRLHPAEAIHLIRAGSPRALIYSEESFEHRVVIFAEADSIPEEGSAASAMRALAADGVMSYEVVEKNPRTGRFETRQITKQGPTGLLTTSTRSLSPQMATRVLEVSLRDDADQTRCVMRAHARGVQPHAAPDDSRVEALLALQDWLGAAGERRVSVPFATRLAELVPPDAVRMRRDFKQLLTTIQAVAFLYQQQRPRTPEGWICATPDDYDIARTLLESVFDALTQDAVTPAVRETVRAVQAQEEVSEPELAQRLGRSRSTISYRVTRAIAGGWLVNREIRKGHPARLALGVPLPEARSSLPTVAEVFESSNAFHEDRDPPPDEGIDAVWNQSWDEVEVG